jgi:hypothetical protein
VQLSTPLLRFGFFSRQEKLAVRAQICISLTGCGAAPMPHRCTSAIHVKIMRIEQRARRHPSMVGNALRSLIRAVSFAG